MMIDLDAIFEKSMNTLSEVTLEMHAALGQIVPMGVVISISDGEHPMYEGAPEGQDVHFTMLLSDLMGGNRENMALELMRGLQYESGNGDVLERDVEQAAITIMHMHPEGYEVGVREFLKILLQKSGRHERDILVMGLQRMIRKYNGIGAVVSLDAYYKKMDNVTPEDVDLNKVNLSQDEDACSAHMYHLVSEHYYRLITKPYTVENGTVVYDEEAVMDIQNDPTVVSRFSGLFQSSEAN